MKVFLTIVNLFISLLTWAQVSCPGTVVHSQNELDSLLIDCQIINGSLILGETTIDNDIHDLSVLQEVFQIEGDLIIQNTTLDSIDQLEDLLRVEGSLIIRNNSLLQSVDLPRFIYSGLNFEIENNPVLLSMTGTCPPTFDLGWIKILNNPNLKTLDIFENLKVCRSSVIIKDCHSLQHLAGFQNVFRLDNLTIESCDSLLDLNDLSPIRNAEQYHFQDIPIKNIDFLSGIDTLESLTIANCRQLTDLSGVSEWEAQVNRFEFIGTDSLYSLTNLNQLKVTQDLILGGHFNLDSVGFDAVETLHTLKIHDNYALREINGLSNLNQVFERLEIIRNTRLQTISGLDNLKYIQAENSSNQSEGLFIRGNTDLGNIDFFPNLEYCSGEIWVNDCGMDTLLGFETLVNGEPRIFIQSCTNLKSINAFDQLTTTERIGIRENINLLAINGFENFSTVREVLDISDNAQLSELNGFPRLSKGSLFLSNNPELLNIREFAEYIDPEGAITLSRLPIESIDFFPNLASVNGIDILMNPALESLEGLNQPAFKAPVNGAQGRIWINGNLSLTDLKGLEGVTALENSYITIFENGNLESLAGLTNLERVDRSVLLNGNDQLSSLQGLHNLTYIGTELNIKQNAGLTDIEALAALDTIGTAMEIENNAQLAECDVICTLLEVAYIPAEILISANAITCSSLDTILAICDSTVQVIELTQQAAINIFPNPASTTLQIQFENEIPADIRVYNQIGLLVDQIPTFGRQIVRLDINAYPSGIFYAVASWKDAQKAAIPLKWIKM